MSGWKTPSIEIAFTVTSGPSTSSSAMKLSLREAASAAAIAAGSSASVRTSVSPRWPCRSGALTTQGAAGSWSSRACGTPAAAKHSRWRCFEVASTAVAPSIGCGSPIRSAMRAAIPTGQSAPGEMTPSTSSARARRSTSSSSSVEISARLSA